MKISIGADHGGVSLKKGLVESLARMGHEIVDHGTHGSESVDYPDYARAVYTDITEGRCERGILVCTSGIGMSMVANRIPGIRAALVHFPVDAASCRGHNDANVLCLGARNETAESAAELAHIFLETPFEGGRHSRRVNKIEGCGC